MKTYYAFQSRKVPIGKLWVGGDEPITVQSMTNTDTLDTTSTVEQVMALAGIGCDIVRIATPTVKDAENLYEIKNQLLRRNVQVPLVADIHFSPRAAEVAARYVEKIRINPSNYTDRAHHQSTWSDRQMREERDKIAEKFIPLLRICDENQTTIRIGTNHGSLSGRILSVFGNTAEGMVASAMEFVNICIAEGFHNLLLSMKAARVKEMIAANIMLVEQMIHAGHYYPLHLGVTEAGNGREARIKSAAGIGSLLARGIGDTLRVSLTEDPLEEVRFGRKLVEMYGRKPDPVKEMAETMEVSLVNKVSSFKDLCGNSFPVVSKRPVKGSDLISDGDFVSLPHPADENRENSDFKLLPMPVSRIRTKGEIIYSRKFETADAQEMLIRASAEFALLMTGKSSGGIFIRYDHAGDEELAKLSFDILQGLGLRFSKTEFVACPSCGRTKFNLFETFEKVKKKTSHLKGLQIAVMGCMVNGPGEMGDADYGYVGSGPGKVTIYQHGKPVIKNVSEKEAVHVLIDLIKTGGDWVDP